MNDITSRIFEAIKRYDMIKKDDRILIALSGGKDSVALFLFFAEYADKLGVTLFCAHVNHMIRGEDADRDQKFCEELCEKFKIPIFVNKLDIPALAIKSSKSVEETARDARYNYFDFLCKTHSMDKIATAHTASDNTETVLYNISRGSGIQGVCGIPPKRQNIIRPLILCTKEQTEEYCNIKNIPFCTDFTNSDDEYDRNNIRLNVVPHLKKRNPSLDDSIARLSYIARCDQQLISYIADQFLSSHSDDLPLEETAQIFEDEKMLSCAREILCRKSGLNLPFDIFCQCRSVIVSRKTGKKVKLSENVYLVINYGKIEFKRDFENTAYFEHILKIGSDLKIGQKVHIYVEEEKNAINYKNINNLTMKATLNFDTIYNDIFVRQKKNGDAYVSGGITRSVKKFFSDSKISREMRSCYPVICDDKGILWVPGMRVCDRARPRKNSRNITVIVEFEQ